MGKHASPEAITVDGYGLPHPIGVTHDILLGPAVLMRIHQLGVTGVESKVSTSMASSRVTEKASQVSPGKNWR